MKTYPRHRFPRDIISYAVWLYHRFKSTYQAQRFLGVYAAVYNLFSLGRHFVSAEHYRNLRLNAFTRWAELAD